MKKEEDALRFLRENVRERRKYSLTFTVHRGRFSQHLITRWIPCAANVPSASGVPKNF